MTQPITEPPTITLLGELRSLQQKFAVKAFI